MKPSFKVVIYLVVIAVMSILVSGCGTDKGDVVAKVGDRNIYIDDVSKYFSGLGVRFISADKEIKAKRDFIDTLVNTELLIIGAYEKKIENAQEVLKVIEGEEVKFLLDILFDKEIISKAEPSEAEIKDWYSRTGEEIKAFHVLVKTEEEALGILVQLKDGGVFEELAVQHSLDPSVKRNQGDLGWFTWGMMVDNFQEAAYALQPGEISAPVKSDFGYHIIKVADRRTIEHRPLYGEVKEQIRYNIIERRKRGLMQTYVGGLKEKYPITIEKPTSQFLLNKLEFLYPDSIGGRPRWRNNIDPQQLDADEKSLVIGTYEGGQMTIGTYLSNLRRIREAQRPDFDQYDSLSNIIFQMSLMDILAIEARDRNLQNDKKYLKIVKRFKERAMADLMLNDTLSDQVEVNDGEIQEYYDTHLDEFMTPLRFHLIEIQVASEKEALRQRSLNRTEEQFKKSAAKLTLRPGFKQKSGDLGIITRQQHPGLFDQSDRTTGNITKPVNIGGKWSVAWIKKRLEQELREYDLCKGKIQANLLQDKRSVHYQEWLKDMRTRIDVEVYDDVLENSIDISKYAQADSITGGQ